MQRDEVANVIIDSIIKARPALGGSSKEEILKMELSELALDSLDLTTLSLDVEDACQVVVEPDDFDRCHTILDLNELILRAL